MKRVMREDIEKIISMPINWEQFDGSSVLITGASGMLGRYMLACLQELRNSHEYKIKIAALMRNPNKLPEELTEDVVILKQSVVEEINTDISFDFVIHTASPASPLIMKDDPVGTIAANTVGTYNTLLAASKGSGKGYLYISSREIYGQPYDDQDFFDEDTYGFVNPLDVRSCYPEGKKAAETMCMCFRQQYGVNAKIARLAHTFGPGMSIDDGRVQADFLRNVVRNENIVLKSEGTAVRTYTYVADAVSALFFIMLNSDDVVYNIASEESTVSIRQLAEKLVNTFPERKLNLEFDIPKQDKNTGCAPFTKGILDSNKIRNIGWKPIYSLVEGLKRTVDYLEDKEEE